MHQGRKSHITEVHCVTAYALMTARFILSLKGSLVNKVFQNVQYIGVMS